MTLIRSRGLLLLVTLLLIAMSISRDTAKVSALSIRARPAQVGLVQVPTTKDSDEDDDDDYDDGDDEDNSPTPNSFLKADTDNFHILLAGYNGKATPYTFTPPSTLEVSGNTLKSNKVGDQPSWATFSKINPMVYIAGQGDPGRVYAVNVTEKECSSKPVSLKVLGGGGTQGGALTGGNGPVATYIAKHILFVANYGTKSASALQLDRQGNLVDSSPSVLIEFNRVPAGSTGPITNRQDRPYPHHVAADPLHRWIYVPDLGADRVHRLSIPTSGKAKEVKEVGSTVVAAGSGPRHIAFYHNTTSNNTYAYLASELSTTLTAYRIRASDGHLLRIKKPQLSLPEGVDPGFTQADGNSRTTSEVAVSPDGRFVYVGTRHDPTEDHVALFARDVTDGSVKFVDWYRSEGLNLRHFSLSPDADASYLAAANQDTGTVAILARDPNDGSLTKTGASVSGFDQVAFSGFFSGPSADVGL